MSLSIRQIKPGDIVELLPTNSRNRQLRKQDKKIFWEVLKIESKVKCFNDEEGIAIESVIDKRHWRWVKREDIKLTEFKENVR